MSLISKLFGKPRPPSSGPDELQEPAAPPVQERPAPDPAALSAHEHEALAVAMATGDAEAISRLVTEGSTTGVRQRAAQAVADPLQLRELLRGARGGKDKHVYRILKAKRDAIQAQLNQSMQLRAEIDAAAAAIERHSRRSYDALFTPTVEQLEKRWQGLAGHASPERAQQVLEGLVRAREIIRQHHEAVEARAALERAAVQAADEAARQRELEREAAAAAAAEQQRRLLEERRAALDKEQAEERVLRALADLLRRAQLALETGNTARAARLRSQFEEQAAAATALPSWLMRRVQQLDGQLTELKDWKAFSIAPKREQLLREIESLAGSTLEPVALVRRIAEVRQQWRTLGKGAGGPLAVEWQQQFQDAAQRAFEPCRVYFAAQAEQRRLNLERRAVLVERLAAFASLSDEQGTDWRLLIQVLGEARREWRRHTPVDRAAGVPLQERFDALCAALQGRLDGEYARNMDAKRALLGRAAALLAVSDTRQAIEEIKDLQRRWKAVGIVPRAQDEPLWEAFRQHCDAVFRRREQDSAAYAATLEANREQAVLLCEEAGRIAVLSGPELVAGSRRLAALRSAFELLELPRHAARELQQRFERALEQCQAALDGQHAREAQRVWTEVFAVADRVRALSFGFASRSGEADCQALLAQAEAAIAAISQWPKGVRPVIERQLAKAREGAVAVDAAANGAALRTLCVRAELLAGAPSPPEDQALRQEQQLQRLVQSMGQGIRTEAVQAETLMTEWLSAGPTDEAAYPQLLNRFKQSLLPLLNRRGR